ncbi:MAG: GNAT family N-acetyltransferase [Lachnospiraceae bacterium]|nr:GNAT family N-acetyltransferase [Lachnospiraceae bacterium]
MNITIEPILIEQKSVFVQMMELYNYDFSEFSDNDINEFGYFGYSHIDDYWNEEGRYPFFIRVDGKLAGLVLVRSCCEYSQLSNPHNIAEFFIMKKYRKQGVGKNVAMKIFDMFPGGWEISQWTTNLPAQNFWRKVIDEYTNGNYDTFDEKEKEEVGFTFDNSYLPN